MLVLPVCSSCFPVMSVEICNSVIAPKSLDEKFFQQVLENGTTEPYVTIRKISFELGSSAGDNYCSQIFRVRLTFENENRLNKISVIVKSVPVTDSTQFLEDLKVFLKEKVFYYNILPRMEILMDNIKFGPKLYHTLKEPISTLVFEDLSALGYEMADRQAGLNFEHCQMVMKKLGQFHAVSMVLYKKDPDSMKSFQCGMLAEKGINGSDVFEKMFGNNLQGLIDLISKWKGFESFTQKVKKYAANLKENLIKSQLPIPGELKVLNHGDLWVNNFLFKYSKDSKRNVEDMVFVDLQLSVFGSPGFDLNYFLFTSLQLDVLIKKRGELLRTYYLEMKDVLNALNYKDIPTFNDILTEVRRREMYGFFTSYAIFPIVSMEKSECSDNSIDTLMDKDTAKKKRDIMFSSKRLIETYKYTLKRFDELNILDTIV